MTRTPFPTFLGGVILIAVTLFSVPAATAAPIVLDAAGAQTLNNLQALALAAHNYESTFGRFPSDYVDGGGTAILSWRVSLLPFLNQGALFSQFDTTKPWNDAVNLPLLSLMPDVFRSPSSPAGSVGDRLRRRGRSSDDVPGRAGPESNRRYRWRVEHDLVCRGDRQLDPLDKAW